MAYSFTEKKRIRRQFGSLPDVMNLPYLIKTQTDSFKEFLQADKNPDDRQEKGLEEVFKSIFPINSASNNAALDYINYELGECLYSPQECKLKGISYAVPLYVNLQLRIMVKTTGYKTIKENGIKEDRVFLGEIPIMTNDGRRTPMNEITAPFQPFRIKPIYDATFIAIGPGKKLAIVMASRIFFLFIIFFLIENSCLIMAINIM